jgi:hypothetical protein
MCCNPGEAAARSPGGLLMKFRFLFELQQKQWLEDCSDKAGGPHYCLVQKLNLARACSRLANSKSIRQR